METPIEEIEMLVEYVEIDFMNGIQLNPEYLECANKVRSWLRAAAEHPVERTEPGLTVTDDATSDEKDCPACSGIGHYMVGMYVETCCECEGTGKS
jgi:hypothetical protein